MDLHILWFVLLGVLLMGYAILDGFDLGVGILYPFIRGDRERRLALNSIGPLWDGNEVWLVVFGGALHIAEAGYNEGSQRATRAAVPSPSDEKRRGSMGCRGRRPSRPGSET